MSFPHIYLTTSLEKETGLSGFLQGTIWESTANNINKREKLKFIIERASYILSRWWKASFHSVITCVMPGDSLGISDRCVHDDNSSSTVWYAADLMLRLYVYFLSPFSAAFIAATKKRKGKPHDVKPAKDTSMFLIMTPLLLSWFRILNRWLIMPNRIWFPASCFSVLFFFSRYFLTCDAVQTLRSVIL